MAKKVKKIEAPIDNQETFVSIQKQFADSEAAVREKLATLYSLQKADMAIDDMLQLRGELPEEVACLEQEVAALKEQIETTTQVLEEYRKSIAVNTNEIAEFEEQIAKYQKQLENISNSREYDSINKEIENQDLLRQIAEKNIRDTKVVIEESKEKLEKLQLRLEVREGDLTAKKDELDNIVETTAKEEAKLRKQRAACAEKIDDRTMSAYDRIRSSANNHLAVVTVYNGNSCGGCFNAVTAQRLIEIASGKKLVVCEHCGRIIVSTPEE